MQTHPVPKLGPFKVVQLSHLRAIALTQDQRLAQLKQDARTRDLLDARHDKAADRRFTGELISNFGALA